MNDRRLNIWFLIALVLPIIWSDAAGANEGAGVSLNVPSGRICRRISQLQCIGGGTEFPPDVERLCCFTRITGAVNPITVTHVWYFGEREAFRIALPVKSGDWRTYSQKTILPHMTGEWRVEVLGPQQEHLVTFPFRVGPETPKTEASPPTAPVNAIERDKGEGTKIASKTGGPFKRKDTVRRTEKHPIQAAKPTVAVKKEMRPPPRKTAISPEKAPVQDAGSSRLSRTVGREIRLDMNPKGSERLLVNLNHYTRPRVIVLDGAVPSVAVHIADVSSWDGRAQIPVNGKAVKEIHSTWHRNSETLRILLDLNPQIPCEVKTYPESKEKYCVEILYHPGKP